MVAGATCPNSKPGLLFQKPSPSAPKTQTIPTRPKSTRTSTCPNPKEENRSASDPSYYINPYTIFSYQSLFQNTCHM
ncbi:hypothetical protein HYC85_016953 [Camellia sinensis]|uniref:Uncharacterized protein n=1 Tax=Camellia sinensis TaxID=4442 RepID=A0A7J7H2D6_CAMSI|nr:hypothetical protein HYC85_016953 [Camellia sinensis]